MPAQLVDGILTNSPVSLKHEANREVEIDIDARLS